MIRRIISVILIVTFTLTSVVSPSSAQVLSPVSVQNIIETGFKPVSTVSPSVPLFNGIKIYPQEPFRFDFIISTEQPHLSSPNVSVGDPFSKDTITENNGFPIEAFGNDNNKEEALKLVKYFMAALTVPEGDLWVNLSPYEPDRIVPKALGQTEMGRDLLAQDYILKQLTASLMSPEGESGKRFWERVYEKIYEVRNSPQPPLYIKRGSAQRGGVTDNTTPTDDAQRTTDEIIQSFNKVWIVPDKVEVYQNGDVAYITNARLKVMLESDYLAQQQSKLSSPNVSVGDLSLKDISTKDNGFPTKAFGNDSIKNIIRDTIIPLIEDEVNNGESFANLRQIFHSMILAKWYEQHFKNSILGESYVDRNVTEGIQLDVEAHGRVPLQNQSVQDIYNQYVAAFKSGAADLIKEEYDPATQTVVPRKYFVGGIEGAMILRQRSLVLPC